jgi:hypothetical protein
LQEEGQIKPALNQYFSTNPNAADPGNACRRRQNLPGLACPFRDLWKTAIEQPS